MAATRKSAAKSDDSSEQKTLGRKGDDAHATGAAAEVESLLDDATELVEHAVEVKERWQRRFDRLTTQHPYLALASAGGAGFVLGGGLTLTLSKRLWVTGARLALSLALQKATDSGFVRDLLSSSDR